MSTNNLYEKHFHKLCEKPRPAGSNQISKIKDYLIYNMEKLGYAVELKQYSFVGWELLEEPKVKFLKPIEIEVPSIPVVWSGSTDGLEVNGKIANFFSAMKTFEAYDWQRYTVTGLKGEPICYLITRPDMIWAQPLDDWTDEVPYIIVDTNACKLINEWIAEKNDIEVMFLVNSRKIPNLQINNIIAPAASRKHRLILCAHYDSMFNTVGAHDNASGVVTLLNLADRLYPTQDNIELIFFDAEEWNKYGSYRYVDDLKAQNDLENIDIVINIDSVGVGDYIYCLTSPSIESEVKRIMSNTATSQQIKIEVSSKKEFPQFDSWPFMKMGIPVIQIGTGGEKPFPYFHHPRDDLKNIDCGLVDKVVNLLHEFVVLYSQKSS